MSLQQLAERSDVSAAAIHKIERNDGPDHDAHEAGERPQPVDRLPRLREEDEDRHAVLIRASARRRVHVEEGPAARGHQRAVRAVLRGASATVEPEADSGPRPMEHLGEELVYVLTGSMAFDVDGEEYLVRRGDALHFRTDRPHRWRNRGAACPCHLDGAASVMSAGVRLAHVRPDSTPCSS